jgi:hypothetical protein
MIEQASEWEHTAVLISYSLGVFSHKNLKIYEHVRTLLKFNRFKR